MSMDKKIAKRSWIRRNIYLVSGSILIFCFVIYLSAFTDNSSKLNINIEQITIHEIKKDVFLDYISVIGAVEPIKTIYLDVTEGGKIEEIFLEAGAKVKRGDLLLKLSNDNLLLNISNNEADVARAINDLKTMQFNLANQRISDRNQLIDLFFESLKLDRQYKAYNDLLKNEHISTEDYNLVKEKFDQNKMHYNLLKEKFSQDSVFMNSRIASSEESVNRMQENLNLVRKREGNLLVKAPVNGELASLNVEIGQVLNYGARIGTINILDFYKLKIEIDEHYISRIVNGLKGQCNFSGNEYPASIKKIYPEVKEGKFFADMEFEKDVPAEIRIGQTSNVSLQLGTPENKVLLSKGGFYQTTGGQWVYVVDQSGKFATKRNIKIGRQNPQYYEVLEGLTPGEKVIVSGYDNFGNVDKLILKGK